MTTTHSSKSSSGSKAHSGEGRAADDAKAKDADIVRYAIDDGIDVLTFDVPGEKQNTLNGRTALALRAAFERAQKDGGVRGIVLVSGKADFIAGADISMLQACRAAAEVQKLSTDMQAQLQEIEDSKKPVVAAIHGACLGGGLEVALACHYRIATDHPKTTLALPEVMLGLLPGGGGTQRLPRLIGVQAALDLMLTGKTVRAKKAKRLGLVDAVTVPFGLEATAVEACRRLVAGSLRRVDRHERMSTSEKAMEVALEDNAAGRLVLFRQARAMIHDKTGGLYPAPLAILDVVEEGQKHGIQAGYAKESERFGHLAMTTEAHSLMHLFFGQTALKKNRFAAQLREKPRANTVAILGAGLMGAGIAEVTAQKGVRVLMKDRNREALARGQKMIWQNLDKRTKSKALSSFERDRIYNGVVPKLDYQGFEQADLVIEAVFEDLAIKHAVLKEVEAVLPPHAVFASNTSALPIGKIAEASKRPENVVGMHYFSPVPKMPLLEVIVTPKTSKEAAALAVEVGIQQGKTVIVVKDGPGFYTTRILGPVMEEAALLALEGVDLHDIDRAMKAWGFPVGPITLLDEVGIDVAAHVAKDMAPFFEPRFGKRDNTALDDFVKAGLLGRKAGKGFFLYDPSPRQGGTAKKPDALQSAKAAARGLMDKATGHKPGKTKNPEALAILERHGVRAQKGTKVSERDIQERVGLRMVNEAIQCLQDGILEDAVDGDIGAVFGLGFPPMKGGPFRYTDTVGASHVASTLERMAQSLGQRFRPAELLVEHAKSGKKFH